MNKSMLVGAVLGAVGVTAGGAVATYSLVSAPQYAEVLAVKPVKETIKTPREVCKDVAVTRQAPVKDEHQIAGTAIGAVVGGLLGNQVGGGNGKKLATVAGAVGGGYLGNEAQKKLTSKTVWVTQVKMKDGSIRPFETAAQPAWASGKVVRVNDQGQLVPLK